MVASRGIVSLLVLLVGCPRCYVVASSASTPRTIGRADDPSFTLQGLKPDTFVTVAPLVVAAECKDGVAIVATHTASLREPLLVEESRDEALGGNSASENESNSIDVDSPPSLPRDLPLTFRGPFRIQTIDGFGTTLACTGWRTDGEALAAKCRALAAYELERFGDPTCAFEYGRFLAEEAHSWMAQCAVSDNVRTFTHGKVSSVENFLTFLYCTIMASCIGSSFELRGIAFDWRIGKQRWGLSVADRCHWSLPRPSARGGLGCK